MLLDLLMSKQRQPAECVIKVGASQTEISDLYPFLTEVTVETSRQNPGVATLNFETRRDEQGKWSVQDAGVFAPWEPILIEAAFGDSSEEIMRGYIREIKSDYPEDAGATTVTVECQDDSLALDREHVRREWGAEAPTSDAEILREILVAKHAMTVHSDSGDGLTGLVFNQDSTDIRFLRDRAEANGYELIFREGEVYFGPPRLDGTPQETILAYAGRDTHCYRVSIQDDGHKPDKVAFEIAATEGRGTTQRVVEPDWPLLGLEPAGSSSSGLQDFTWLMSRQGGRNEEEMAARAQRKANEQAMKVRAEGELDGSLYGHVLRVGEPVPLDGVGERYGGTFYVDSVNHRFNMEGYRQAFTLLRNAYGDDLEGSTNPLAAVI